VPTTDRAPGYDGRLDIPLAVGEREVKLHVLVWRLVVVLPAPERIVDGVSARDDMPMVDEETGTQRVSPKKNSGHAKLKMVSYCIVICVTREDLHYRAST
jgi:hypothetical protein